MKYPYFSLRFKTKRLRLAVRCDQNMGLVIVYYRNGGPVFNLVSDSFADSPSPLFYSHEWGLVRWGIMEMEETAS